MTPIWELEVKREIYMKVQTITASNMELLEPIISGS